MQRKAQQVREERGEVGKPTWTSGWRGEWEEKLGTVGRKGSGKVNVRRDGKNVRP